MIPGKIVEISLEVTGQILTPHKSPVRQQEKTLHRLLKKARKTQFGRHYGFDQILADKGEVIEKFQSAVPLHDYNTIYNTWWSRTLHGEANIAWPGRVKYFALSSGTSEATSKHIPITHDMLDSLRTSALRLFSTLPTFDLPEKVYTKSWLAIGGTSRLEKIEGHYEGYLSGINARKRPFWSRAFYKPGSRIASIVDFDERAEQISNLAPNWDVGLIVGIPHWIQITMEKILKRHRISSLKEIWPNLECFVSGGVDPAPYRNYIEELAGKPLAFINTYLASEGFIAFQNDPSREDLQLLLNTGIFYEFIPYRPDFFDAKGNIIGSPPVYKLGSVREGIDYALILTTCSGAWRYHLGDIVRFTDTQEGRIKITGRTKYYLNLCTEHLTSDNMSAAMSRTEDELEMQIPEFMIAGIRSDNRFIHHWYVGTSRKIDAEDLREVLDRNLKEVNDDYKSEREGVLEIELEVIPVEKFYQWQMKHPSRKEGVGQTKIPRILDEDRHTQWKDFLASDNTIDS